MAPPSRLTLRAPHRPMKALLLPRCLVLRALNMASECKRRDRGVCLAQWQTLLGTIREDHLSFVVRWLVC